MSLELVFLSILLIWVSASGGIDDFSGQIFIFMVLLIVAAESALGLVYNEHNAVKIIAVNV